jgi:hypothetical protein
MKMFRTHSAALSVGARCASSSAVTRTKRTVRIGGASGFWGDSAIAAPQLLAAGTQLDYLVFDYLAETTLAIMARMKEKRPDAGYATDFVDITMKQIAPTLKKSGVKVISNAGGINPLACKTALEKTLRAVGVDLKVGVVLGDDLLDRSAVLRDTGVAEMFSGERMPDGIKSSNAYLGARPIAALLAEGCDVVITGRCVDSAVTLGACIHEFGWADDQYDALAGGTIAGHIIECGAGSGIRIAHVVRDPNHARGAGSVPRLWMKEPGGILGAHGDPAPDATCAFQARRPLVGCSPIGRNVTAG